MANIWKTKAEVKEYLHTRLTVSDRQVKVTLFTQTANGEYEVIFDIYTKNDYFLDMFKSDIHWVVAPSFDHSEIHVFGFIFKED